MSNFVYRYNFRSRVSTSSPLHGFDNQFSHVLFNLISNAIDALKDNPPGKPRLIRVIGNTSNSKIILRIEDSGSGIPKDHADKIFDMYFTTKEADGWFWSWSCYGKFYSRKHVKW